MKEDLFQYIWNRGLFDASKLRTTEGGEVTLIQRGTRNTDSGPDFSNAHVRIGDTDWFGHIELHLHAGDWKKHGHENDPAYNTVILHVVLQGKDACYRSDGSLLPQVEIGHAIPPEIEEQYSILMHHESGIACENALQDLDAEILERARYFALTQRMERKGERIRDWLRATHNNWTEVLYRSLARACGSGVNSDAFGQLAMMLPLKLLLRHSSYPLQCEALVFGTAGFLTEPEGDEYTMELKSEWQFLRKKYGLQEMSGSVFKNMRMRPGNFPDRRLAQFSVLAVKVNTLFAELVSGSEWEQAETLLSCEASAYWKDHYRLSTPSDRHSAAPGRERIHGIIINGVIPFLYVFAKEQGTQDIQNAALRWLHVLPPENNHVTRTWKRLNIHPSNAADSQALLELKQMLCDNRKCLSCPVGQKLIGNADGTRG